MSEAFGTANEEYEEITSEEVDRIVESLEQLTGTAISENIRTYLEEATNNIYALVYDEESAEDEGEESIDNEEIDMEIDEEFDNDIMEEAA
ncbi:hypothetical protein MNBD_PLANCTO02-3343 [hydrothermal vent metagenome]|uniref:Uncharacterized protein n=1 Tax=hydrothermal vent metagenome TaxID=652676 RepID=A0A3B1DDR3_9ZZZZ